MRNRDVLESATVKHYRFGCSFWSARQRACSRIVPLCRRHLVDDMVTANVTENAKGYD
jgi:hypothetical protein